MKILVADDHQLIVDDIIDELISFMPDAECIGTNDPDTIEKLADTHHFDVIFMDIDLDSVNGIDIAEKILKKYPRTNIIYVTSHSEYALDSYRTNASTFLMKPVNAHMLKNALTHLRFPVSDIKDRDIAENFQGNLKIGQHLHAFRLERGLTTAALAKEIGCAQQTVYRWENGTRVPDIPTLIQIARILDVTLDDLTR